MQRNPPFVSPHVKTPQWTITSTGGLAVLIHP
jgi:hypothetical protein